MVAKRLALCIVIFADISIKSTVSSKTCARAPRPCSAGRTCCAYRGGHRVCPEWDNEERNPIISDQDGECRGQDVAAYHELLKRVEVLDVRELVHV